MSNHKPNMIGLEIFRLETRERNTKKIRLAISTLRKAKKVLTVSGVAKITGLSTATIYKYQDLVRTIQKYRDGKDYLHKNRNTTLTQLELINQGLVIKNKELAKENSGLKSRIDVLNEEIFRLRNNYP